MRPSDRRVRRAGTLREGVIRQLRLARGLAQWQLAQQARVTERTVSRLEQGLNGPHAYTLGQICKVLGVAVEEVLGPDTCAWEREGQIAPHNGALPALASTARDSLQPRATAVIE